MPSQNIPKVVFLNTREHVGADVEVHLTLLRQAIRSGMDVRMIANRHSQDRALLQAKLSELADGHLAWTGLGLPKQGLARAGWSVLAGGEWMANLARLAVLARLEQVDVIHATDRPRDAVSAVWMGRWAGAASVVHMHSNPGSHLSRSTKWGLNNATRVIAISDFVRRGLMEMGVASDRIAVVPNAVDPVHFDPSMAHGTGLFIRAKHGIPRNATVLCQVARINPWKGQRETIAALGLLARRGWRPFYLIVGAGARSEIDALRQLAADCGVAEQLVFAGFHHDVRPYLDASDGFIHPSHEEPFGLSIVEAMAMAMPVVACSSGGVPEIMTDGRDGFLVPPHSPTAIAQALSRLRALPDKGARLGRAARSTVCARFTPAIAADAMAGVWARLCRNADRRIPRTA